MARTKLGDRLTGLRIEKGVTQDEAADAVGVARSTLAALEGGHDKPGLDTFIALANYYGVSADWLATGQGDPRPTALQDRTSRLVALFDSLDAHDQAVIENLAENLAQRPH